ncbi:DsbE family thiol:disulfide interchange protein [Salinispirillum sp. LH 10-3-1]|uniref:DsbE family thiol:disulfide interchange protein n=1 Tax=Salinispirillum sp. LH 10-3-1 TaxID=2952525 RepID=A0AB38YCH1_9GAMM
MRWALFIPFFIVLIAGTIFGYILSTNQDFETLPSTLIGRSLPAFELQSLYDENETLTNADIIGEPFLFNVWGSWCPSCRIEHPVLNDLAADGVRIVGLNYRDSRDGGLDWLERLKNPYVMNVFDPLGMLGFDLGITGAPETFFVDAEGIVRHRHVGVIDHRVWESSLAEVYRNL